MRAIMAATVTESFVWGVEFVVNGRKLFYPTINREAASDLAANPKNLPLDAKGLKYYTVLSGDVKRHL